MGSSHLKMSQSLHLMSVLVAFCSGSPMLSSTESRGEDQQSNLLPETILQTCSSLAPDVLQPLINEAQKLVKDMAEMKDLENTAMVMDMEMDLSNFSLSEMTVPIPGMGEMTVRSFVQMEAFNMYGKLKKSIENAQEDGVKVADLPVIKDMKEDKIKKDIMKMYEMFLKHLKEVQTKMVKLQTSVSEKPYIEMAEKYTNIVGKMLGEQKKWDDAHETVMCVYDIIADGEDPEMAEVLKINFPRDQVESFSKKLHTALHSIFKSPYLGEVVRKIAECVQQEFMSMDDKEIFSKIEDIGKKVKERVTEIPFEDIILLGQEMVRKTWDMLMIGEAPELEKLMDLLVYTTAEDSFWETLDMEVMNTMEMMNSTTMMMTNSMLSDGCEEASNPVICCFKTRAGQVLDMIEHLAEDLDTGDIDHCEEMMKSLMGRMKMMIQMAYNVLDLMFEKYALGCMVDPYIATLMNNVKTMMPNMISEMTNNIDYDRKDYDDVEVEDIINTLEYALDDGMEILQLGYGACPEEAQPEPLTQSHIWAIFESWVEAEIMVKSEPSMEAENDLSPKIFRPSDNSVPEIVLTSK